MESLLAVDVGLRTGMALFQRDGRLCWYRSRKLGTTGKLRRIAHTLCGEIPDLTWLVLEGGGSLAEIWKREAVRREIEVLSVAAEMWRQELLYPRQQENRFRAKKTALTLARRVIEESGAARPTALRHDTAEAILVGLWGMRELGWID